MRGTSDVRAGQSGGVIDTVTDHGHAQTPVLQLRDLGVFVLGQDLGEDLINA